MNNSNLSVRHSTLSDLAAIQRLFVDTISSVCMDDYSPEQIKAWTSSVVNTKRWSDNLASQYFLVAELDYKIVGFASLEGSDYLDFLYVHKDYQKQGIANKLYLELEKEAVRKGGEVLYSDVSKTARPFFEKHGFKILQLQNHAIQGVEVPNYYMIKQLFDIGIQQHILIIILLLLPLLSNPAI